MKTSGPNTTEVFDAGFRLVADVHAPNRRMARALATEATESNPIGPGALADRHSCILIRLQLSLLGQLYRSMVGKDGWCVHFNKSTRTCSIFEDRPRFCRVEPAVFEDLYDIPEEELAIEACRYSNHVVPQPALCCLVMVRAGGRHQIIIRLAWCEWWICHLMKTPLHLYRQFLQRHHPRRLWGSLKGIEGL